VWIGHFEGVTVFEEGEWFSHSSTEFGLGEYSDLVNDVAIDHDGRLWVATEAGVATFDGDKWTSYDKTSGLSSESTEAILVDKQHRIWVGHDEGVEFSTAARGHHIGHLDTADDLQPRPTRKLSAASVQNRGTSLRLTD